MLGLLFSGELAPDGGGLVVLRISFVFLLPLQCTFFLGARWLRADRGRGSHRSVLQARAWGAVDNVRGPREPPSLLFLHLYRRKIVQFKIVLKIRARDVIKQ